MQKHRFTRKLHRYYHKYTDLINPEVTLDWVNTKGWESEIYAYTLTHGLPSKRTSSGRVLRLLTGSDDDVAQNEFRTISLLAKTGYPVPEPYRVGQSRQVFRPPFIIMARIEGGDFAKRFTDSFGKDPTPLRQFIRLFRQLHSLAWQPYVPDPEAVSPPGAPYYHFDEKLAKYAKALSQANLTEFDPVLAWLKSRRQQADCPRGSVVHMDFHHNNILEDAKGQLYVIDWTAADISDFRFDLGWTLTLATAYMGMEARNRLLTAYEQQIGQKVNDLEIFEVVGIVRRLATAIISIRGGAKRMGMRKETAQVMRREGTPLRRLLNRLETLTQIPLAGVSQFLNRLST